MADHDNTLPFQASSQSGSANTPRDLLLKANDAAIMLSSKDRC
jgi:hypothetical protein